MAPEHSECKLEDVRQRLSGLSLQGLLEFHSLFNRLMDDAYSWDLWGAAYLINGGCSDDGFAYFRSWLISRGGVTYEAAVRDADSLADIVDVPRDEYEFEDLWGLALEIYKERTSVEPPSIEQGIRVEPEGRRWDFNDDEQVSRRLPRLAELYRWGVDRPARQSDED